MPTDWITPDDVAEYLGPLATETGRIEDCTYAAKSMVEKRRSDLDIPNLPTGETPADVHLGTIIYAALLYQARVSPTGYAAFGDGLIDIPGDQQQAYMRAMRLIGLRRPVAL